MNEWKKNPHFHRKGQIPTGIARENFTEEKLFKQRSEGSQGASDACNWRKRIWIRKSKLNTPVWAGCLACSRTAQEAGAVRADKSRQERRWEMQQEQQWGLQTHRSCWIAKASVDETEIQWRTVTLWDLNLNKIPLPAVYKFQWAKRKQGDQLEACSKHWVKHCGAWTSLERAVVRSGVDMYVSTQFPWTVFNNLPQFSTMSHRKTLNCKEV